MNQKIIIAISIFGILLLSQVAFASVSTVSTSMSTSRATTGTSVTSTVTVTATGSESGSVQLVCTPSGVTISDPSSGSYQGVSLSSTPKSNTFTMAAGTSNTYTCQGQSGGMTGDATIVFVDPSSLTVTGTPSSKSGAKSSTFSLAANIQNSQSNAITTSYSLSGCGGSPHTCTGDSTSGTVTVAAGTTTALTWTVTIGGTSSASTLTLSLGDNSNALSSSVTCTDCATSTTPTPVPVPPPSKVPDKLPPGVQVTSEKGKATVAIPSIPAGGSSSFISIPAAEDVSFSQINIFAKEPIKNVLITVTKLPDKPSNITQDVSGKIYEYIQVEKNISVDSSINRTDIRFKVSKSWLSSNNINDSAVALYRYSNDTWNKLETTKMTDDGNDMFYDAVSPGLSVFAISGELKVETPQTPQVNGTAGGPSGIAKLAKGKGLWLVIGVVVLAVAGAVIYLVKKGTLDFGGIIPRKQGWNDLKKKYRR